MRSAIPSSEGSGQEPGSMGSGDGEDGGAGPGTERSPPGARSRHSKQLSKLNTVNVATSWSVLCSAVFSYKLNDYSFARIEIIFYLQAPATALRKPDPSNPAPTASDRHRYWCVDRSGPIEWGRKCLHLLCFCPSTSTSHASGRRRMASGVSRRGLA